MYGRQCYSPCHVLNNTKMELHNSLFGWLLDFGGGSLKDPSLGHLVQFHCISLSNAPFFPSVREKGM